MGRRRKRRVDPTREWEQIELLCAWPEQREYERIRPLVLFGDPNPLALRRLALEGRGEAGVGDEPAPIRYPVPDDAAEALRAGSPRRGGWLKALRVGGYSARARRHPDALQQAL